MKLSVWHVLASTVVLLFAAAGQGKAQFINGDFETGNLTGWTTYITSNGTLGPAGFPNAQSFDTTGSGASLAAHFNVGNVAAPNQGQQGGGLIQSLALSPGNYSVRADIASLDSPLGPNSAAGLFSVLADGATVGSNDLGPFSSANQTLRGTLVANFTITTNGSHEFRFQITRPFLAGNPNSTPQQYLDNIVLTGVPEPSSLALLSSAALGLVSYARRWRNCA